MIKEEIKSLFMQGIDCSQVVAGRFADELEMEESFSGKCPPVLAVECSVVKHAGR